MSVLQTNRWAGLRRWMVGIAVLLTIIGLFYTEENWSGRRALEDCKREVEKQGISMDWAKYAPAPVPDEQNFFGMPEMELWFENRGEAGWKNMSKKLSAPFYPGATIDSNTPRLLVAEVTIGLAGKATPDGAVALRWDDPAASAEAAKLLTNAIGPTARAPRSLIGPGLMMRRPDEIQPAHIFLQCKTAPSVKELEEFLPDAILNTNVYQSERVLKIEPSGEGAYRVTMPELPVVADCLAWNHELDPQLALVRQALGRPYARMQGNYGSPATIPIPNFITVRSVAQALGARAECHFLTGQADEACSDLTLIHEMCRPIMESNAPMTLVGAMINGAVRGLYAGEVADGLRLQAWHEPQLAVLEEQLKSIHILVPVRQAFEKEACSICFTLETTPPGPLLKMFLENNAGYGQKVDWWTKLKNSSAGALMPRGWLYQNAVALARLFPETMACTDSAGQLIFPDKVESLSQTRNGLSHWGPYTWFIPLVSPNFIRAYQSAGHNQTLVQQALVACALERFRLARGQYPESLEALVPQFLDKIPADVIGGEAPHYRRAADGTFILYSIGWSGRDGGGERGKSVAEGDWVWPD